MTLQLADKGFNYTSYYNGAYENADSLPDLANTGANAVALNIQYGIDVNASSVYADASYTDSLDALGSAIDEAKGLGLSVMVRPLIDFLDPAKIGGYDKGDWRSYYNPTDPATFFASYKDMILAQAQVAQAHGADSLCIGAEIDQLCGPAYLPYWTDIISAVRQVFTGTLTYSADWNAAASPWQGLHGLGAGTGDLATQISFWNQLDSLGVDCYAPLSDAANPSESDLVAGWTQTPTDGASLAVTGDQSLISYFDSVAAEVGKPLQFTELGYESATDAASQPAGTATNAYDPDLQASLYQAFFDAWNGAGDTALTGVYFWNWDPNAAEVGPGNGANFSPQGEPAQDVVASEFAQTAPPPTPNFAYTDTTTGAQGTAEGDAYAGPVDYLQHQYIWAGADNVAIAANVPNAFIHGGPGDDALAAAGGSNVLDGGTGSNFLVGASGDGADTFFVDGRGGGVTWSTVAGFHHGDAVTIWGYVDGTSTQDWEDNQGAAGYQGLTLHSELGGAGTGVNASFTLAGMSTADLGTKLTVTPGAVDGNPYLYIAYTG